MTRRPGIHADDPLWFKDAILYELHVRAFCDSNGDGIGDFRGLAGKLDYLHDLGVTALWLLPFCPSPWRDDGYDISDYAGVHPAYGTLRDFQAVLGEAHDRGLRVITELVLNHTSDQHPWFRRARRSPPGSRWRDFYVWSDTADKFADARVIFKDFENSNWAWDPVAKAYYWHRFYSHQPDLNFDNPEVGRAVFNAVDFWFDMGVDGLRLDAVPYLYEREGTNCENLTETHQFLKQLRRHVDEKYGNRLLLAEANQWPEDAVSYFGDGDECHMAFHFPLMPRLFMAQRREDSFPIADILEQTPQIPPSCQWGLFLRNHDELTLEMVTDEERDYMYRVYGQDPQMRINLGIRRRLAPLLGNSRRRNELMNALLFSLPGTPIIYYGDEIGMGDNVYLGDRDGVRTPMQWNVDRNAGFSRANPQRLYLPVIMAPEYHYESVNVESQQQNPHSMLWWMRRLIALRKRYKALARGRLNMLNPENHHVFAFLRAWEQETVLVVANLSRFSQPVELDLSEFRGAVPVELFGRVKFPAITDSPYFLAMAPHSFYWFALEAGPREEADQQLTAITSPEIIAGAPLSLAPALRKYINSSVPGNGRGLRELKAVDFFPFGNEGAGLAVVEAHFVEAESVTLLIPVFVSAAAPQGAADPAAEPGVIAELQLPDLIRCPHFGEALFSFALTRRRLRGRRGELCSVPEKNARPAPGAVQPERPVVARGHTFIYDDRLVLKLARALETGLDVQVEVSRFVQQGRTFPGMPAVFGSIEYRQADGKTMTAAVLQQYVAHQGTAWAHTLDTLGRYFERAFALGRTAVESPPKSLVESLSSDPPREVRELISNYLDDAALLGKRTAELHLRLASDAENPDFAPEPFSDFYRIGLYHSLLGLAGQSLRILRQHLKRMPEDVRTDADRLLEREAAVRERFRPLRDTRISAALIRNYGDLHLRRVLWTGSDFCFAGFGGEPGRPLTERRIKRSCLRDLAQMLRSFDYASAAAKTGIVPGVITAADSTLDLEFWLGLWRHWVSVTYLRAYMAERETAALLPKTESELKILLDILQIEAALHEILRNLDRTPDHLSVPVRALLTMLD